MVQGEIRRQLAVVNLSASMSCLLERLHQAEGVRLGARQQERLVREEERMREERELSQKSPDIAYKSQISNFSARYC